MLQKSNQSGAEQVMSAAGIDPAMKPPSPGAEFLTEVGLDVAQNFIPGLGFGATRLQKVLSGLGSATGRTAAEGSGPGGEIAGSIIGGAVLPAFVGARLGMIYDAGKSIWKTPQEMIEAAKKNPAVASHIQQSAMADLAESLKTSPEHYARQYAMAEALEKELGINLSLGEKFTAPSILSREGQLMRSSGDSLNQGELRSQANQAALSSALRGQTSATPDQASDAINRLAETSRRETQQQVEAGTLAAAAARDEARRVTGSVARELDLEQVGEKALAIRGKSGYEVNGEWVPGTGLKGQESRRAFDMKSAAVDAAEREGARYDLSGVIGKTREILRAPIWDDLNTTAVHNKVLEFERKASDAARDAGEQAPQLLDASGRPFAQATEQAADFSTDFRSAIELREAINKDIASALTSNSQNAREQLRNLQILKNDLDVAIKTSPFKETSDLYDDFIGFYRKTFAPKFLRGVNRLADKTRPGGDPALVPERVFTEYLRPNGAMQMNRYVNLYGDNPEAMSLMHDAILDRYTKHVIGRKGGDLINPSEHRKFMSEYRAPLEVLRRNKFTFGKELEDANTAFQSAMDRALVAEQSAKAVQDKHVLKLISDEMGTKSPDVVIKQAFDDPRKMDELIRELPGNDKKIIADYAHRYIADKFTADGLIGHVEIEKFLNDKAARRSYQIAMSRAYSPEVSSAHIATMEKIVAATKRLELTSVPSRMEAEASIKLWQDFLSKKIGVSIPMLFNLMRSVVTTRTSAAGAGVAIGGQALLTVRKNLKNDWYRIALTDPDTAKILLKTIETPTAASAETSRRLFKEMGSKFLRLTAYLTGADRFPGMAGMSAANAIRAINEPDADQQ
jgi:hypothetical protein